MNGTTAGTRGSRRTGLLIAVAAAVALLAAAFHVQVYTTFSTGSGPAGSAAYRQEITFAQCMRGYGVPDVPDPPPGDSISMPVPRAAGACEQLAPGGRETTNIRIVL
ncbi:MAG TPA: hypothetical protein VF060_11360 [Trebonia sp.]